MPHRLADDLGGRLAVHAEEGLVVELVGLEHRRVEPDRIDDPQVVDLVLGDVAGADGVQHAVGDRRLDGAHQDVRVLLALDRHLAHHHGIRKGDLPKAC